MSEWAADCFLIQQKVRWNYFTASLILCRKMTKLFVERGVICHLCNDAILRRPFSIKRFCQLFGIRTRIVGICRWDCWPLDYHGPPRLPSRLFHLHNRYLLCTSFYGRGPLCSFQAQSVPTNIKTGSSSVWSEKIAKCL